MYCCILLLLYGYLSKIDITYDGNKEVVTYCFTKGDLLIQNPKINPQVFADADYANDPILGGQSQGTPIC